MALPTTSETRDFANFSDNGDGTTSRFANVVQSALPDGAATEAKQDSEISELQAIKGHVDSLEGLATDANSKLDTVNANLVTIDGRVDGLESLTGSLTETPPATDTDSSGLNGRLQRIAQRLTSLIALLPASLGQKLMTQSLAVVVASDQSPIQVVGSAASAAVDSGNPVKAGAKYNAVMPTFTDGHRSDLQSNSRGHLYVSERYFHAHLIGAATTTIKSGAGFIKRISINRPTNGTATFYDNTTATGTPIITISYANGASPTFLEYGFEFTTGLTVVTTGTNTDLSVMYL